MRIVLDTNVLLSATLWEKSSAGKIVIILLEEGCEYFGSEGILNEYSKVLKRDFEFSEEEITENINDVKTFVTLVEPESVERVVKDDPDDDKIIACAVTANAGYLLTYDKHLLRLKHYRMIQIMTPEEFITQRNEKGAENV